MNSDEDKQLAIEYLNQQGYEWPHVRDEKNSAWRAYRIRAQPTVVVIQPDGIVFEQAVGYGNQTFELLRSEMRRLGIDVTSPPPASVP